MKKYQISEFKSGIMTAHQIFTARTAENAQKRVSSNKWEKFETHTNVDFFATDGRFFIRHYPTHVG
jgi:hypothetical protein